MYVYFRVGIEQVSRDRAELSVKKSFLNCLFPLKDRTWRRGLVCHPQGWNAVEDSRRSLRELTHGVPQESPRKGSKQRIQLDSNGVSCLTYNHVGSSIRARASLREWSI